MIDRIVYVGHYNNKKSNILFNKAVEYLKENKGDKFYYILPNGKLLTSYRRRILEEVGQTFNINLFTFDNIADRLLDNSFYTIIDDETKEAILESILDHLREKGIITYYRDMSYKKGFIKSISSIIGEIKRSLIIPKDFLDKCPNSPFYREIGLIYEEYQNRLNELNLLDREESFFKSLEKLREGNSFFDGLDFIIIDYFFDFRPQEMELLKEIAKTKVPIYINMPFEREYDFDTLTSTMGDLEKLGFIIEGVDKKANTYYEDLSDLVFSDKDKKLEANKNVHVIKAANSYLELKKISEEIKKHYKKGVDLRDMSILVANTDKYKDRIFQVFDEEKIPCNTNKEIALSQIPLLEEIIYILEVKKEHMDKNSIINRIKSNYFSLCDGEKRDAFEYILRKENSSSVFQEELEDTIKLIEDETKAIPEKASLSEFVKVLMDILENYQVGERILYIYNRTNDYNILNRDISAIVKFKEVLEKIERYLSLIYEEIFVDEFIDILKTYLQNENIVEIEGNADGVNILTPVNARGQDCKVLFVLGMSQGDYTNIGNRNFFFKENNYKTLKQIGIDVKSYYEVLDKESLMFSTALSTCSDELYLSYSQDSEDDENSIPSIFLDEVLNRIEGDKIEDKVDVITVNMDYILKDKSSITTKEELSRYILGKYFEGDYDRELFYMFNDIDKDTLREVNLHTKCEYNRSKDGFNDYSGLIDDKEIVKDIGQSQRNRTYSISYLESYGKCPYYFMMNNLLKVEEMERVFEDFTPLDRGSINHQVLKEYYFNYKSDIEDFIIAGKEFNVDKTYDYIQEKIEKEMSSITSDMGTPIWRLRIENNTNKLLNFIKEDLIRMSSLKKKLIPYELEVPFGRYGSFELEVDNCKIPFTGIIDRIDKYVDEDKYIVIDYKNSSGSVRNKKDMEYGLSLQLPIYMMSQEDKNVVLGMYGLISTAEFKSIIGNVHEKHLISKRNSGALTEEEMDDLFNITKSYVKTYIDSIQEGNFSINPKECSPYCIYKDICRYKGSLEVI